jgi:hypothetical protein
MKKICLVVFSLLLYFMVQGQTYFNRNYDFQGLPNYGIRHLILEDSTIFLPSTYYTLTDSGRIHYMFLNSVGDTLTTKKVSLIYTYFGLTSASPVFDETDSSIIFSCLTNDTTNNPNAYLSKLSSTGDTLWTKIIGGTGYDCFHTILTDTSGYYFIGLTNSFGAGSYDVWFVKTDRNGNVLQNTAIGNAASNQAISACWSGDGNIMITGSQNYDDFLMKVNTTGILHWQVNYQTGMGQCFISTDSSTHFYLASSFINQSNIENLLIRKVDSVGAIIWERFLTSPLINTASVSPIIIAPDGRLYLATSYSINNLVKGILWCFAPNGDSLWSVTYESTPGLDAYFYHLSPFPGGGFLMSGFADSPTQYNNAWLVRVDSNGCLIPGCLTSVEELEQVGSGGLQLMPNPANERETIILPEQETGAVIQVYDVAGKLLQEQTLISQRNFVIDCSVWHNGMYFVNVVTTEGKRFTGKFSVVH